MRMRSKKSTRSKKTAGASKTGPRTMGPWTISLVVCVVAAAVLIAARQPSPSTDVATVKAAAAAQTTSADRTQIRATTGSRTPAESGPGASVHESAAATITGCLEGDGQRFELKDTSGTDVPKARSWKSGFLKKAPASIDVVDSASSLNLSSHVGQRVTLSGSVEGREMQARSLRRVAPSCD